MTHGFDFCHVLEHPERLFLSGKCDDTIFKICKDVGWLDDLKKLIPKHTLDKHYASAKEDL